jgi:hypothetical protein
LHRESNGRKDRIDVLFFENETRTHQLEVAARLMTVARLLLKRAVRHDASKLQSGERDTFIRVTPRLKELDYGSDAYNAQLKDMKLALEHHYLENAHHPEHYSEAGVNGMNLVDVVEMFCDWCAAVKRHDSGDIQESIEHNEVRFGISPQLSQIFRNTVERFPAIEHGGER